MPTRLKLKISDNNQLRAELDKLYENKNHKDVAKWSLQLAKHILRIAEIDYSLIKEIVDGFNVNELWQKEKAGICEIREAGFKIHKLARQCESLIKKTVLRAAGQAVASGHMKEHAMIASDYAIKVIGLISSNNTDAITLEREWQINELKRFT